MITQDDARTVVGLGTTVRLSGVHKVYQESASRGGTFKETLLELLSKPSGGPRVAALNNVNLEVARGEALGIVGANGSGKSTLLKIIGGIVHPTAGEVEVNGRLFGMIELGAGFHRELTGEENVRLQGTLYGLTSRMIGERIESIFDYAELADFKGTPLKFYSSGMVARLGFAIAIHCDPEILLIDEVLSVGDQAFQDKCLRTLAKLRRKAVTLIFVTHQMDLAERLCERILWLKRGERYKTGPSLEVLQVYHREMLVESHGVSEGELTHQRIMTGQPGRFGSGEARMTEVRIVDGRDNPRRNFRVGEPIGIEIDYRCVTALAGIDCYITVDFEEGSNVAHWRAEATGGVQSPGARSGTFRLFIPNPPFLPGRYTITIAISRPGGDSRHYDLFFRLHHFAVLEDSEWASTVPVLLKPALVMPSCGENAKSVAPEAESHSENS